MAQVNSGIGTKACTFDFTKNGALGNGIYSWSGIEMKPGESIMDIRFTKFNNFASGGGGAVAFRLGWGPNPTPLGFFTTLWADSLNNCNTYIFAMYKGVGTVSTFNNSYYPRISSQSSATQSLWFTSDQALTGGSGAFVITYMYAKF